MAKEQVKILVLKRPKQKLESDVYSVPETARKLKTAPENVYALIRLGKLKCLMLSQQSVPKFELQRFMNDNLGIDLRDEIQTNIEAHKKEA
ncbi:hypothetical protein [Levilactobacillus yiduensis]|uniref:hypothetical protein n=1 Tax=Levilactobacillus yiduensis TaxID=2953880 RepID=UPI002157575F|nr:hypothetical protein [Levilactobacillus yiduensis]